MKAYVGLEVLLHSFLNRLLYPGCVGRETGWTPELVRAFWKRERLGAGSMVDILKDLCTKYNFCAENNSVLWEKA
jgi:predicted N-acyltransferase